MRTPTPVDTKPLATALIVASIVAGVVAMTAQGRGDVVMWLAVLATFGWVLR
jgi:hypothetical protein